MAYDPAVLEHIFWAALTGPHAAFASGSGGARRYVAGFSPIIAFADPQQPDFDGLREVSGVCTHPAAQGRGLASALIRKLLRRQLLRGATPFLHVMHDNPAHRLYQRMGFRDFRHTVVRVLART